jgi:hypothetical protein
VEEIIENGENCIMKSLMIILLRKYLGDHTKEEQMGGACGAYGVGEMQTLVWW